MFQHRPHRFLVRNHKTLQVMQNTLGFTLLATRLYFVRFLDNEKQLPRSFLIQYYTSTAQAQNNPFIYYPSKVPRVFRLFIAVRWTF